MALEKDIRCAEKIILEKTKLVLSDGQEIWWSVAAVLVCFGLSRPSLCVKVGTGGPVVASTSQGWTSDWAGGNTRGYNTSGTSSYDI